LNLKNTDISIFLKKEGKDSSTQISLQFSFTCGYEKNAYKNHKTTCLMVTKQNWDVFNNKIIATAL